MYDISFLKRARELCDQYDVLLIFDEVATGFGRTGNRFVADLVLPDILVLGKALTGGYIGHAVTVANHKVFDAFYSDDDRLALMHGPTFMGNPLACAVALKGIEIFEREDYMSKIRHIEQVSRGEMEAFTDPRIKEVGSWVAACAWRFMIPGIWKASSSLLMNGVCLAGHFELYVFYGSICDQ